MRRSRKISEWQTSLPFQSSERGILSYAFPWERRFLLFLGTSLVILAALYSYFVFASIVHVAKREELAVQVSALKSGVSELESTYLAKTSVITESYAKSLGYVTVANQHFVERSSALTFKEH